MEHFFIVYWDDMGTYFDEYFDYHSACQECINLTDLNDINNDFSSCDIIKGKVIN